MFAEDTKRKKTADAVKIHCLNKNIIKYFAKSEAMCIYFNARDINYIGFYDITETMLQVKKASYLNSQISCVDMQNIQDKIYLRYFLNTKV